MSSPVIVLQAGTPPGLHYNDERQDWESTLGRKKFRSCRAPSNPYSKPAKYSLFGMRGDESVTLPPPARPCHPELECSSRYSVMVSRLLGSDGWRIGTGFRLSLAPPAYA